MAHALGVYYAPTHGRQSDRDYIAALQPPVIRLFDDPDVQQIADAHALAPNAIIAPRSWVIDDNNGAAVRNLMADPVGTGHDHAHQYRGQMERWQRQAQERGLRIPTADRIVFNSANEPNQGGEPAQINAYCIAFLERCKELGLRAMAPCLGVGWPGNTGPDTPVDWSPYAGLEQAIRRGNHFLCVHEYFYKSGPQDGWKWWAGRHLQCPFDVPYILGEAGIDNFVDSVRWSNEGGNRGWQGNVDADTYAGMIEHHIRGSSTRVFAVLPFITDYRSNMWESFDTGPAHNALLAHKDRMVPQNRPGIVEPPTRPDPGTPPTPIEPCGIIDPIVGQTLIKVESGGQPFGPDGKVLIRFEAHIFQRELKNDALFNQYFAYGSPVWTGQQYRPGEAFAWHDIHDGNQESEYAALALAVRLNPPAAYNSMSMGLGQVMGFNAERVGYANAEMMYHAFSRQEQQVIAFINFFLSDPALRVAVQQKDWRTVARLYNGSGQVDLYSSLLEKTYKDLGV